MSLAAWIFYRDNPEQCGLEMDGSAALPPGAVSPAAQERSFTRGEAMKTGWFWVVVFGLCLYSCTNTGIVFHIVDLGAGAGLDRFQILAMFPPIGVVSVLAGLAIGAAADRVPLRYLFYLLLGAEAASFFCFSNLINPAFVVPTILTTGLNAGAFVALVMVALPKLYGRAQLGAIASALMSALVLASAVGPSAFALARELSGSYSSILRTAAFVPLAVGALLFFSKDPQRRP